MGPVQAATLTVTGSVPCPVHPRPPRHQGGAGRPHRGPAEALMRQGLSWTRRNAGPWPPWAIRRSWAAGLTGSTAGCWAGHRSGPTGCSLPQPSSCPFCFWTTSFQRPKLFPHNGDSAMYSARDPPMKNGEITTKSSARKPFWISAPTAPSAPATTPSPSPGGARDFGDHRLLPVHPEGVPS